MTQRAHGRDADGKFKNHEHYLAMVNELNTAEATHESMFEGISQRLKEPEFLETSVKATTDAESEEGSTITIATEAEA